MRGPGFEGHGRCALHRLRLPAAQVHENRSHHDGVLDQRDDAHRAFALHALERIGFIHLADQPRPSGLGAARVLAQHFGDAVGSGRRRSGSLRLAHSATAARVPTAVPHELLVAIGDVFAEQLQPLGARHDLEVPLQSQVHLRAVDHRAGRRVVAHLGKRERRAQHVAGELLFGPRRHRPRRAPGCERKTRYSASRACGCEAPPRSPAPRPENPAPRGESRPRAAPRGRRQFDRTPRPRPKDAGGASATMHVRIIHQVAEGLDELDERGLCTGHRGPAGLLEQAGGDAAKLAEPGAPPREHRPQQPRHGELTNTGGARRGEEPSLALAVHGTRFCGGTGRTDNAIYRVNKAVVVPAGITADAQAKPWCGSPHSERSVRSFSLRPNAESARATVPRRGEATH